MAPGMGRYLISSPATSAELRDALQAAIDAGTRTVPLSCTDIDSQETAQFEFRLVQTRYREMSTEFLGTLADQSTATIVVMTHPDLSSTPARLTLARRHTP
jgi:hypothetical protein